MLNQEREVLVLDLEIEELESKIAPDDGDNIIWGT
jgi:hypothetical protein